MKQLSGYGNVNTQIYPTIRSSLRVQQQQQQPKQSSADSSQKYGNTWLDRQAWLSHLSHSATRVLSHAR